MPPDFTAGIRKELDLKLRPAAIFSLCSLIFFIVFVYLAQDWRMQARLYPFAIGIPMIILALIQVILDCLSFKEREIVQHGVWIYPVLYLHRI